MSSDTDERCWNTGIHSPRCVHRRLRSDIAKPKQMYDGGLTSSPPVSPSQDTPSSLSVLLGPRASDYAQSEIITLLVGAAEAPFMIHKDLLVAKSEYFRAALTGSFAEAGTKEVKLDVEDMEAFKDFVDWAYTGRYALPEGDKKDTYISAYQLADRLCSEAFCNDIIDAVRTYHDKGNYHMKRRNLLKLYEVGLGESMLAKLGVKQCVRGSILHAKKWLGEGTDAGRMDDWVERPLLLLAYAKEMVRYQMKPYPDKKLWDRCEFHEHKMTKRCGQVGGDMGGQGVKAEDSDYDF